MVSTSGVFGACRPLLSGLRAVLRPRGIEVAATSFFFLPGPNLPQVKRQELPKSVRISWNSPV